MKKTSDPLVYNEEKIIKKNKVESAKNLVEHE